MTNILKELLLNEALPNGKKDIDLLGGKKLKLKNDKGETFTIADIAVAKESYIPDIYVYFTDKSGAPISKSQSYDLELWDDKTFIDGVMAFLKKLGYNGKTFNRAELGMQGPNYVVLEPAKDFNKWVAEKYDWKYLG
jgi:hypothetical protein